MYYFESTEFSLLTILKARESDPRHFEKTELSFLIISKAPNSRSFALLTILTTQDTRSFKAWNIQKVALPIIEAISGAKAAPDLD